MDSLAELFEKDYGFTVEKKLLDSRKGNPSHQLMDFLTSFVNKHDGKNTLLIIYYAGHGFSAKNGLKITA